MKEATNCDSAMDINGSLVFPEYLEEMASDSEEEAEILALIQRSYLDTCFSSKWKPYRIERVSNKHLSTDYDEKRQDFLIRGRRQCELEETYGFCVENSVAGLETVAAVGLQTLDSEYNPLGYSRLGVYVCKHADICLQHALVKHAATTVLRLIVFKYVVGRLTTAIPRPVTSGEFIEPTQGYDCHISALPPASDDPLQTQFDRSQVYLYEINKLLQPSSRPRQVIPIAVVSFTELGQYVPAVDAKATVKEKLDGNPRLQQIVRAINSKEAQRKEGVGLLAGPNQSGVSAGTLSTLGGMVSGAPLIQMNGINKDCSSKVHLALNGINCLNSSSSQIPAAAGSPGFEQNAQNCLRSASPVMQVNTEKNCALRMIVNRINARLDAEGKPAMSPNSNPGDGLLPAPTGGQVSSNMNGSVGSAISSSSAGSNSSPIGSRPGSAESFLSGINPSAMVGKPAIVAAQNGTYPHRHVGLLSDNTMKAASPHLQSLPAHTMAQHPNFTSTVSPTIAHLLGLNGQLGVNSPYLGAHGLPQVMSQARKEPALSIDYSHMAASNAMAAHTLAGQPGLSFYPGLQSQALFNGDRLGLQNPYGHLSSLASSPVGAMPQANLTLRPVVSPIKRPFPDGTVTLTDWDKRPKFF